MLLLKVEFSGTEYKLIHVLTALDSGRVAESRQVPEQVYDSPERPIIGPATTLQVGQDNEVMEPIGVS